MRARATYGFLLALAALMFGFRSLEAQEVKTLKERLSDKASDEQRLDNCGVPPERRGPTPRPGCAGEPVLPAPPKQKH
jgi:hypothetical protein